MVCSEYGNGVRVREKGTQKIYRHRGTGSGQKMFVNENKVVPEKKFSFRNIVCPESEQQCEKEIKRINDGTAAVGFSF